MNRWQKEIARKLHGLKSYDRAQQHQKNPCINAHELRGMKINVLEVRLKTDGILRWGRHNEKN